MAIHSTRPFSYRYPIQLLMRPTLKVLKHFNRHPHSSQKFTNETGKTLCDHFDAVYGSLTLSSSLLTLDNSNMDFSYHNNY